MSDDERPAASPLNGWEAEAARLREQYPQWRIWYVRNPAGRTTVWCAQPARYPFNAGSADELAALIETVPYSVGHEPAPDE